MENTINPHNELPVGVKRNLPRDVFLHLLAMVTLYWSAISFITLCHNALNYLLPAVTDYGYMGFTGSIRFAVSSLIIVFPIFIVTSWFLNKIYSKETDVRESKIRKWLIYLTLFVTALVIIGDLVYTINVFLGGEVTLRFTLKALSIIVVAGVIFGYYLDDVRRDAPSKLAKYFAWVSAAVVLAALIGSFFIIGSPARANLEKIDQMRVADLQNIQWQLLNHYQRTGALPEALQELDNPLENYVVPVDPETNQPYEYSVQNAAALKFQLCANFGLESVMDSRTPKPMPMYPAEYNQTWNHTAGRVCFERTIDKQLYPPINK